MANIYSYANLKKFFADDGPSLSSKIPAEKGNTYDHVQTKIKDSIFLT